MLQIQSSKYFTESEIQLDASLEEKKKLNELDNLIKTCTQPAVIISRLGGVHQSIKMILCIAWLWTYREI